MALLYYKNDLSYCESVIDDVEEILNEPGNYAVKIVMKEELDVDKNDSTVAVLQLIKSRARSEQFIKKRKRGYFQLFYCAPNLETRSETT